MIELIALSQGRLKILTAVAREASKDVHASFPPFKAWKLQNKFLTKPNSFIQLWRKSRKRYLKQVVVGRGCLQMKRLMSLKYNKLLSRLPQNVCHPRDIP